MEKALTWPQTDSLTVCSAGKGRASVLFSAAPVSERQKGASSTAKAPQSCTSKWHDHVASEPLCSHL